MQLLMSHNHTPQTGAELRRVEIPSRFTHDVVRSGGKVYVCDTGNGRILEYDYPAMTLVGLAHFHSIGYGVLCITTVEICSSSCSASWSMTTPP